MADALINFFVTKLGEQLVEEGKVFAGVCDDVEWIKKEFDAMGAFLKDADRRPRRDESIENWIGDVRTLLYDAEDIIDEFVVQIEALGWNIIKQVTVRHRASSQIRRIKRQVIEVSERRKRYDLPQLPQETTHIGDPSSTGPGAASSSVREENIVGIEDDVEQVSELLLEGKTRARFVLSVFGMGGLGKTTLVKEIYKTIKSRFDCYSWVYVSQSPRLEDVLRSILSGFKASKEESAIDVMAIDKGQLQDRIYHYLEDKKYLLVLDDIWDSEVWERLKHALPRERGRVIFTTRIRSIASPEDNCQVYDLQPLPHALAWDIFCRRAFRRTETCPEDLQEFADAIVRRCAGLPLAVVAIAGLLASKNNYLPEWQSVLRTLDWEQNNNRGLERLNKTLLFSYNHLPYYLKYCFLYTGLFPEDCEIGRKRLIRMWVAEGFIKKPPRITEEELANDYFAELLDRSMIQALTVYARDEVNACKVHDLMRDIAVHMFKQEKFGAVLADRAEAIEDRQRRLSIYDDHTNVPRNMDKLNLRSFLMFRISEMPMSVLRQILLEIKLVRVLDLRGLPVLSLPDEVGNLIHLRYLDLRDTLIQSLPNSLKKLRNLQTLDIRNTNVKNLPAGINRLRQLRHLHMASFSNRKKGLLKMCKGKKYFSNLQTLSGVEASEDLVKELLNFTNLRKLFIGSTTGGHGKELCISLAGMNNLRSLTAISENPQEQLELGSLNRAPPLLEKLKLIVSMTKLPEWFNSLSCLQTLYMYKNMLQEDPFPILGKLPCLGTLILASSAFSSKEIRCPARGFPRLKLLRIVDMQNWETWSIIEEGTMPCLQYLLIADCPTLMRLPDGFQHLIALQDLTFTGMSIYFSYKLQGIDRWKVSHVPEVSIITQVDGEFVRKKL